WFILGARCRHCEAPISGRYVLVETLAGLSAAALWWKVAHRHFEAADSAANLPIAGIALPFFLYFAFLCLLVVIALVDLDHYIIPHEFTIPGILLGLVTPWILERFVAPGALYRLWPPVTPAESGIGMLAGGLLVLSIYFAYYAIRGIEGLGGGDVTLMALVGAWLGWPSLIFILFAASLQGILAAAVAWLVDSDWLKSPGEIFGDEQETSRDGDPSLSSDESPPDEQPADGKLAVPFGPCIVVSAIEHFFLGPYLPTVLSMSYLYEMWFW
ncbi:MAG: A24 family peptidase, partial [Bradymonadaceae bacterium]